MKLPTILMLAALLVMGCGSEKSIDTPDYPDQMGEIAFDPTVDDPEFRLCNEKELVHSRTSLSYVGGRKRIEDISREIFAKDDKGYEFNGYIMVRFLVNCQGETGRLRFEAMDGGFMEQAAPEGLIELVDKAVRALDEWIITKPANEGKDHSKYLNFKMKNGKIDAIIH